MNIHEHQAKALLKSFGAPVADGVAAFTVDEAVKAAESLPGPLYVVKSQIHAGGRGKGRFKEASTDEEVQAAAAGHPKDGKGGVQLCKSVDEVREAAAFILGNTLVTKQTGEDGQQVSRLYIEGGADIARELYLSVLLDRSTHRVMVMASSAGGTDIEDVAEEDPDALKKEWVDPAIGLAGFQGRRLAKALGMTGKTVATPRHGVLPETRPVLRRDGPRHARGQSARRHR